MDGGGTKKDKIRNEHTGGPVKVTPASDKGDQRKGRRARAKN